MEKLYSYSSCLNYFSKLIKDNFPPEYYSKDELDIIQKDIISICLTSNENF